MFYRKKYFYLLLLILHSSLLSQSSMISTLDSKKIKLLENWATYIVIGAGAAGSVVAARLAENPDNKVLIIELGPNNVGNSYIETPGQYALLWDNPVGPQPSPTSLSFKTEKQLGRTYYYPRGNGFGGSTNHHSLIDGWGSGLIYDLISKLVNDKRWASENVFSYFKKMESYNAEQSGNYRGTQGWLQIIQHPGKSQIHKDFMQAAHQVTGAPIQKDLFGHSQKADGISPVNVHVTPVGKRSAAFSDLLLPQMRRHNNVIILFNTLATKIIFDTKNSALKAIGVETIHKPHAYQVDRSLKDSKASNKSLKPRFNAKKEIIISAGAINTPQLLLLSGIGPAAHLRDLKIPLILDRPGVGSDLMDHHEVAITYEINPEKTVWPGQATEIVNNIDKELAKTKTRSKKEKLNKLRERFALFADTQEHKIGPGTIILDWYSGMPTEIGHDLHCAASERFWFDFDFKSINLLPDGKSRGNYYNAEVTITDKEFPRVFQHYLLEVLKVSHASGSIRLYSSDPTAQPRIDLGLYKDDEATERLARGILMIREIVKHPLLKQYYKIDKEGNPKEIFPGNSVKTIDQLKKYLKRWSAFGHHISGTAKMGLPDNPTAVVDTQLRVHGIPNLRIVDTSIYPNPYLHGYNTARAAYLVGEMAADFIKETATKR